MIYGFGSTFFQNVCGLAAALFLNNKFKGRNGVRVILYMPIMISAFIMGRSFTTLYRRRAVFSMSFWESSESPPYIG